MKKILSILIIVLAISYLTLSLPGVIKITQAAPLYPIPDLGNCQNVNECYLYCQIPENSPACWSYGKYILNPETEILGESTVNINYPISELGNCQDANACFIYCNQPKNQSACRSYAKTHGLIQDTEIEDEDDLPEEKMQEILTSAQTELGCNSKEQCMSFCSQPENIAKCEAFAKKHNLNRDRPQIDKQINPPPSNILQLAQTELGCTSEKSCREFCNTPENAEKCMDFAKNNNLMRQDEYESHKKDVEKYQEQKEKMLEDAKTELGCDSYESCAKFCNISDNLNKCMQLGKRHGITKPPSENNPQPKPCTSESECRAYCEKNPQECKGFTKSESRLDSNSGSPTTDKRDVRVNSDQHKQTEKKEIKSGEFLGPGGCKTEGECRSYCEKHPLDCPGFPSSSKDGPKEKVTPLPSEMNTQSSSGQKLPLNATFHPSPPQSENSGSTTGKTFKPPEYKPPENKDENKSSNSGKDSSSNSQR